MAKKRIKGSKLKQEYNKQRRRIKKYIQEKELIGFYIPDDILPKIPKKITKSSIARLKKITSDYILRKSTAYDPLSGEEISAWKRRNIDRKIRIEATKERKKRKKDEAIAPLKWSEYILQNYIHIISNHTKILAPLVMPWINGMIATYGKDRTAKMIAKGYENGQIIDYELAYSEQKIMQHIADMQNYMEDILNDESLDAEQIDYLRSVTPTREALGERLEEYLGWID